MVYLPTAHPSAADRYSAIGEHERPGSPLVLSAEQGYHDTGEEKMIGREREGERKTNGEGGYETRDPGPGREKEGPER